jgi:hypothetical protein
MVATGVLAPVGFAVAVVSSLPFFYVVIQLVTKSTYLLFGSLFVHVNIVRCSHYN